MNVIQLHKFIFNYNNDINNIFIQSYCKVVNFIKEF
jgi:hypothetical protein